MNIRILEINEPTYPTPFRTSADVFNVLKDYGRADREVFLCLYLNSKNQIMACEPLHVGTVDSSPVYPREVLKGCIVNNASSVIVAHNHPTGNTSPSEADREITRNIMAMCLISGLQLLDHVIIGRASHYSMADNCLIADMEEDITKSLKGLRLIK